MNLLESMMSDCVMMDKRTVSDGIGGFTIRGTFMSAEHADAQKALPMGLVDKKTVLTKDIKKGEVLTYDHVKLNNDNLIVQLRKLQDELFI